LGISGRSLVFAAVLLPQPRLLPFHYFHNSARLRSPFFFINFFVDRDNFSRGVQAFLPILKGKLPFFAGRNVRRTPFCSPPDLSQSCLALAEVVFPSSLLVHVGLIYSFLTWSVDSALPFSSTLDYSLEFRFWVHSWFSASPLSRRVLPNAPEKR